MVFGCLIRIGGGMKKVLFLLFIAILINTKMQAQNLVPNPGFEIYNTCPYYPDQVSYCTGWSSYNESPDYYNVCADSSTLVNIPYTFGGYQYAASGNGMCGMICYSYGGLVPNFREIIGCHLLAPLQIGTTYYICFKVNMSIGGYMANFVASNGMGVKFTTRQYSFNDPIPIDNNPDIYSNIIITDSVNWTTISGSFAADSAYQYMAIGNFFDDAHTDTLHMGWFISRSHYFIDDVCVSDKIDGCLTGIIENLQQNKISISPNPFTTTTQITLPLTYHSIAIAVYDIQGKLLIQQNYTDCSQIQLNRRGLNSGLYFLKLTLDDRWVETGKVVVRE
jgi:hypothetical protein